MIYRIAHKTIDMNALWSMEKVLNYLRENSGSYSDLMDIDDQYDLETFGEELPWHYFLSDARYKGAYVLPVKEGFLYLPYDNCNAEYGHEQFLLEGAHLCDENELRFMAEEANAYASGLVRTLLCMQDALSHQRKLDEQERGDRHVGRMYAKKTG